MNYSDNLKRSEILIVDDNPEIILLVASLLRRGKYLVSSLTDGRQIFEVLKKQIPDLILLDVIMKGINGFEICKKLKEDENYKAIPVIFFTGMNDAASIVKGFEIGAEDYISKPVSPDELLARVKTHINLKQRTDRLFKAYKEIEDFNYMISHDLKAPLRDIQKLIKYLEVALASNDINDVEESIKMLSEKSSEAVILVDKLSQLTRMSSIPLKIEAVDMNKLINEVYKEQVNNHKDHDIEFHCACLPIVFGDRLLLRQVWVNVLSNALKFTRDRKPGMINVDYYKRGLEHVFLVKDNGVGFDMKYSGKLFGMFQRMHSQQEFEGTGAGLAIVKKIIDRHNGNVWMEAEPDKGAVLSFTLPVRVN